MKQGKGITLIALVITIIIMLILVAVTISLTVQGGLFGYAQRASTEYDISTEKEIIEQAKTLAMLKNQNAFIPKDDLYGALDSIIGSRNYSGKVTDNGVEITFTGSNRTYIVGVDEQIVLDYFYIYHTKDCSVERILLTDNIISQGFDITAKVDTAQYLYGGYYSEYGGCSTDVTKLTYTNNKATDEQGVIYDGSSYYVERRQPFWRSKNAYKVSGQHLTPEPNTVYYLKEVPNNYLTSRLGYVYENSTKRLNNIYLCTVFDDRSYTQGSEVSTIYGITLTGSADDGLIAKTAHGLYLNSDGKIHEICTLSAFQGVTSGVIVYYEDIIHKVDKYITADTDIEFTPYWITLDGVTVYGIPGKWNTGNDGNGYCTYETIHAVTD